MPRSILRCTHHHPLYALDPHDEREVRMTQSHPNPPHPRDPYAVWLTLVNRLLIAPLASLLRLCWRMLVAAGNEARKHVTQSAHERRRRDEGPRRFRSRRGHHHERR